MSQIVPQCLPLLIGSLPLKDHQEATDLIFKYTPEYPLWPQLPAYHEEGMILQYLDGFPGVVEGDNKVYIDTEKSGFEEQQLAFYEEFLMASESLIPLNDSRFAMSPKGARGFFTFLNSASENKAGLIALKGQTTGPITFSTALVDQNGRAIYYNDQLRDAAIKHLALKARWQTERMGEYCDTPIMFFDEPGLAGLGSSAFITITHDDIVACFKEVFEAVRQAKGLNGVHVCANTEWPVLFDSGIDVVSYDAYSYFDKLILYPDHVKQFLENGGLLASGIVPTSPEHIDLETVETLVKKWFEQTSSLEDLGFSQKTIFNQTFITPSCGTGTVTFAQAERVLQLTRGVADAIREQLL